MQQFDIARPAGGVLHGYDTGPTGRDDEVVVFWHGGTANIGEPPAPLLDAAAAAGIRFLGADRPGYGGTTRDPAASIADVVPDVEAVADARGVDRFAVLGHSGGGPRALACAALLPRRVLAAAAVSSPVPPDGERGPVAGFDRFAGMAPGIVREQRAAAAGREALRAVLDEDAWDDTAFTDGDGAALGGEWSWFGGIVEAANASGPDAQVDDLLAAARPWGFDLGAIRVPVLLVHGDADRLVPVSHSRLLAELVPGAVLQEVPGAGHIDVLLHGADVLVALRAAAVEHRRRAEALDDPGGGQGPADPR